VLVKKAVEVPGFDSSVEINVEAPVMDMNGQAFLVDGCEHLLDGTLDLTRPAKYGIATPANVGDVTSQIAGDQADQILGAGGSPSVGQVPPIDITKMMEE